MAGLMAAFEKGLIARELDSAVASGLAIGAFGRAGCAAESFAESEATVLEAAGESVVDGLVASDVGSHIRRRAADSNKEHLRVAAIVKMRWAATLEA